MSNPPAFQTYASDFYMDTNAWSVDEMGIYQRLLLTEWVNGSLPDDENRLSRIAGCGLKKFQKGWTTIKVKFHLNGNGYLINNKMEEIRKKQLKYSESRRNNVSTRYKDKVTHEPTYVEDMKPVCILSSSSSSSLKKKEIIKKNKIPDSEWLKELQKKECYSHLNIQEQFQKCLTWFDGKVSRKRFLFWINNPKYNPKPMVIDKLKENFEPAKVQCNFCEEVYLVKEEHQCPK